MTRTWESGERHESFLWTPSQDQDDRFNLAVMDMTKEYRKKAAEKAAEEAAAAAKAEAAKAETKEAQDK